MATLLAPYNTAMQLGSGFNSFTQQLCVDHAVTRDRSAGDEPAKALEGPVAQDVTFKSSIIDKVTDVTNAMNINAAFAIKYDAFNASGKGDFINTSKIKESDISFLINVKVVNQVIYDYSLTKFDPISELKGANFADVYGDCFISGFQEGGEFTAVISIKAKDRTKAESIKAEAAIGLTKNSPTGAPGLDLSLSGQFGKSDTDFLQENETTISVTWTGGGQDLKKPEEDWSFETMRAAALKFPFLVARTPIRTHAVLTKYSALRSFYAATLGTKNVVPNFGQAGVYMGVVNEAYLDYKTIAKNLQVLAFDVSAGKLTLGPSPAEAKGKKPAQGTADTKAAPDAQQATKPESENGFTDLGKTTSTSDAVSLRTAQYTITEPYLATLVGVESARQGVRLMLNRIVAEVDSITKNPELAVDEKRQVPYMSPFLFKDLLPVGVAVPAVDLANSQQNAAAQSDDSDAVASSLTDMAGKGGGAVRF